MTQPADRPLPAEPEQDRDDEQEESSWPQQAATRDDTAAPPAPDGNAGSVIGDEQPGVGAADAGPSSLEEVLGAVDQHLAGHAHSLDRHGQQISVLTEQVDKLTAKDGPSTGVHLQRFRFERVAPEVAWAAQLELAAWTAWLVVTFGLEDQVPPCWPRHDGLSEELAGLYLGWIGAWSTDSDLAGPLVWHERLYRFRDRPLAWGHGVRCSETRCGLDVAMSSDRTRQWLAGNQLVYDGQSADGFRFRRATAELPAPIPPAAAKPATPTAAGNGKAAAAAAAAAAAGSN